MPIFQDAKTGKRVRQIGGINIKEDTVMVRGNDGVTYYTAYSNLVPCSDQGVPNFQAKAPHPEEKEEAIPAPFIELPETRVNVNRASAEELAKRVPGVGYNIAKKIKAYQTSLPGEKFATLQQLESISNRVNWQKVIESNTIYVE